MRAVSFLPLAAVVTAQSTVSDWGQCGGMGWNGPTKCGNPNYTCVTYKWVSHLTNINWIGIWQI